MSTHGLSLGSRLRVAQLGRTTAATGVVAVTAPPVLQVGSHPTLVRWTAVWLVLAAVATVVWHLAPRPAPRLLTSLSVLDGVVVGLVVAWAGAPSLLVLLAAAHLAVVTLAISYRTGLKTAVAQCLSLLSASVLSDAGVTAFPALSTRELWSLCAGLTTVALACAWAGATNERGLRRVGSDLRGLAQLSARLDGSRGSRHVATTALQHILARSRADRAVLLLLDGGTPLLLAHHGVEARPPARDTAHDGSTLLDHVMTSPTPFLAPGIPPSAGPALQGLLPEARDVLVLPLWANNEAVGVVVLAETGRSGRISSRAVAVLGRYADQVGLALSNAALLEQMERLATTDTLTGLANRGAFDGELFRAVERGRRTGEPVSLALIDIDHFKTLNDTYGHQRGDDVLRAVGNVLATSARAGDLTARYGGEEFVVLMPGTRSDRAVAVAERLRAELSTVEPDLELTASVGVATACAAGTADDLLRRADVALYRAKEAGRDRTVVDTDSAEVALSTVSG